MEDTSAIESDRRMVAGVVARPRLMELLDRPVPQICVLRASSAAGKTTLLRSWALGRADATPLLWVTISSEVASPSAFWARVIDVARRRGGPSAHALSVLSEQTLRSDHPIDAVIGFVEDMGSVVLVLDAYEKVGDTIAQIDQDLLRLTAALPQVRVIVAARGRTGLAEDGLRLRDRVQVIDDRQLAFTSDEVAQLLQVHLDRDDPALAASITHATRGYALAVRALLLAMSSHASVAAVGSEEWRQLVATDLRTALPDDAAARFVALTSVPPYFDAALAAHLTRRTDVRDVLTMLEWQGFGRWIPYARGHPVFQYVDPIRDAFNAELRRDAHRDYLRCASIAARWSFSHGDHEMAFDLALEAHDYGLAVQIYVDLLRENPECYLTDRLSGPLGSLPVRVLNQHSLLAFALGLSRLTHPVLRASASEAFLLALNNRSRSPIVSPDVDRFIHMSVRAVSLRLIGRFTDSARSSRAAIAELDQLPAERRDQFGELIAMILRQLSYSLLQGGAYKLALATMARSATLTEVPATRNCALSYITGTHAFRGNLPDARAAHDRIDPHAWTPEAEHSYLNAMTVIGEGLLQLDALDFQAARATIDGAESFTGTTEFWALFSLVAVHAQIALGDGLAAARHIEAILTADLPPHSLGDNTATRALLNLQAIAWLAAGRVAKAERILASAAPRAAEVVPARLLHLILTGRCAAAVERLSRWVALPRHTVRTRASGLALGAAAALRTGNERLALSLVTRTHYLHNEYGVHAHLVFLPASDRGDLAELAEHAGDIDTAAYLRAVIPDVVPVSAPRIALTEKELVVLTELVSTGSREQIAARLMVSPNTVKSHLASIYRKLGVSGREAALGAAAEYELFEQTAADRGRRSGGC